jgi:hypothetical protein
MLAGLAVGAAAGLATRSRWAMLSAPLLFLAALELTRLPAVGPTVDGTVLPQTGGVTAG